MVCISTSVACTDLSAESVADIGEADLDVEWSGGIAKNADGGLHLRAYDDPEQYVFDSWSMGSRLTRLAGRLVPLIGGQLRGLRI